MLMNVNLLPHGELSFVYIVFTALKSVYLIFVINLDYCSLSFISLPVQAFRLCDAGEDLYFWRLGHTSLLQ